MIRKEGTKVVQESHSSTKPIPPWEDVTNRSELVADRNYSFIERDYDSGSDTYGPKPAPPPPSTDEARLTQLETDNAAEDANVDALLANPTWGAPEEDEANKIMLRQSAIADLKSRLGK